MAETKALAAAREKFSPAHRTLTQARMLADELAFAASEGLGTSPAIMSDAAVTIAVLAAEVERLSKGIGQGAILLPGYARGALEVGCELIRKKLANLRHGPTIQSEAVYGGLEAIEESLP